MRVALLAGGTGAARLAVGFAQVLEPAELTIVCNTADDLEHWGVRVCPDVDAVLYRLAGIFDEAAGFGIAGDTHRVHERMRALGDPGWFLLGDADLAHCLMRSGVLRRGGRLTDGCVEVARRLGVRPAVLPMSDDDVRTWFTTDAGCLGFQEYFVRERARPRVERIEFGGIELARPSPEVLAAVRGADVVVIGPSNPLISIGPILELLRSELTPERTLAVSPIVAGRSLKGPTVEMMRSLGLEPTALGVARHYRPSAASFVLDVRDRELEAGIADLGYRILTTDTVMADADAQRRLAVDILRSVEPGA
jgi:LPPG:FO 2-phospho-L-lactate transferase